MPAAAVADRSGPAGEGAVHWGWSVVAAVEVEVAVAAAWEPVVAVEAGCGAAAVDAVGAGDEELAVA